MDYQPAYLIHFEWNNRHYNEYHWGRLVTEKRHCEILAAYRVQPTSEFLGIMTHTEYVELTQGKTQSILKTPATRNSKG
jgi:hypothetical protein